MWTWPGRRRQTRKRVVIVGLGDTGLLCAVRLSRHFDVSAVSTKPCMLKGQELGLRLARPTAWRAASVIDFHRFRGLDAAKNVVHGRAISVDIKARVLHAETSTGEPRDLPYDALLIATGARNGFWRNGRVESLDAIQEDIDDRARVLAKAGTLAIVGGGASGVSAAVNAKRQRPEQAVHLFFSRDLPLPGYHPRTRVDVARRLAALGVVLHPEHRAVVPPGGGDEETSMTTGTVQWQTGQAPFEADAVLWTLGHVRPNSDFLPSDILDADGFVVVDTMLRVPGWPGVFALGDVASTDPHRSSARNMGHQVAVRNIRAHLDGRPQRMRPLKTPPVYRWGSVFGLQPEGLRVYFPNGRALTFWPLVSVWLLFRLIVGEVLYRGIRAFDTSAMH